MTVINTNINALYSQMALSQNAKSQSIAMRELSTGKRINSAADDAAGMAISTRMTSQIKGLNQAVSNSNDAINLIQTANGATTQITTMLQRMRELAVQAANDTNSDSQRSYLDLEFQQLKQQIVQISNDTEWNGFPILNGSAGARVGIQPVYKTVSSSISASSPPYAVGTYNNGLSSTNPTVTNMTAVNNGVNLNMAGQFKFSLNGAGTSVASATFTQTDGTVIALPVASSAFIVGTGVGGGGNGYTTSQIAVDVHALATANGGAYLTLAKQLFSNANNEPLTQSGGTIVLSQTKADGSATTFGANDVITMSSNFPTLPTMKANDLIINGVTVGPSIASSDTVSVANNAAGSAIAKAAAINLVSAQTGVVATVNPNLMPGSAMVATQPSVTGTVTINGYTTPIITSTANNTRQTRSDVINAINFITQYTGVKAVDTNSDTQGITLVAADGRNIQVNFNSQSNDSDFSAATGLDQGIRSSTYSLESAVNTPINLTTSTNGIIASAGLQVADYTSQVNSSVSTGARAPVTVSGGQTEAYVSGIDISTLTAGTTVNLNVNLGSTQVNLAGVSIPVPLTMSTLAANLQTALQASDGSSDITVSTDAATAGAQTGGLIISSAKGRVISFPTVAGLTAGITSPPGLSTKVGAVTTARGNPAAVQSDVSFGNPPSTTDFTGATVTVNGVVLNVPPLSISGTTTADLATAVGNALTTAAASSGISGLAFTVSAYPASPLAGNPGLLISAQTAANTPATINSFALIPNQTTNIKPLQANDLSINGINIRAALAADDTVSPTLITSSSPQASGIATAAAINASSAQTGVTAIANPVTVGGNAAVDITPYPADPTSTPNLYINGVGVYVDLSSSTAPNRIQAVMNAINPLSGKLGVVATQNSSGGISLTANDGRNVSVWYNNSITGSTAVATHVSAASFGLGITGPNNTTIDPPGVTGTSQPLASFKAASTVYGGVTLVSPKPIDVEPGTNGNGSNSNFRALGFQQGVVGGLVEAASAKITPPRTGRLSFQVGADANQTVSIDLPDFGVGGPITSQITWDANLPALAPGSVITEPSGPQTLNGVSFGSNTAANPPKSNPFGNFSIAIGGVTKAITLTSTDTTMAALASDIQTQINSNNGDTDLSVNVQGNNLTFTSASGKTISSPVLNPIASAPDGVYGGTLGQQDANGNPIINGQPMTRSFIGSKQGAVDVLAKLDFVMNQVNAAEATMGAVMNRLNYVVNNLTSVSMNLTASESAISDADYASASTQLSKTQIMQQAATAVLAQANTSQQSVLKLLQG